MTRRSAPFAVLAVGYLGIVALITLGPTLITSGLNPWRTRPDLGDYDVLSLSTWLDPDTWSRGYSTEFLANILLFVPLGVLVRLALPRLGWIGAVAFGGTVSITIEVLQVWTPRISDPRDVVANSVGALIGALLAAIVVGVSRLLRRAAERSAIPTQSVGRSVGQSGGQSVSQPVGRR